ncbi:MAG: DUF4446 family protein [Lachnospiraceae bacterium]|nr:DUF4446 family protein [Lachnospiraceae bacterium]
MNSNILNSIGLGTMDPAIFIIILLVICIALLVYIIIVNKKLNKLSKTYDRFMRGKDAESLEDVILQRFEDIDKLIANDRDKDAKLKRIFDNLQIAVQKVGIVKYDAFNEMGGKLSFALAMLDKENNGYVINAMHSREGCYTYIKEIIKGESYIPLGTEEKEALNSALEK